MTCGEILPDGAIIDLVAATDRDGLGLLFSDGKEKPIIVPVVNCGDGIYHPPALEASILAAVPFPHGVAEYGDITILFSKMLDLYQNHLRWPQASAAFMVTYDLATWLSESMPAPPTICILGASAHQIFNLFKLSRCLGRRALRVGKLTTKLPLYLRPTLLITDPGLTPKTCEFWTAANFNSVLVPGAHGALAELSCAKAILLGPEESPEAWGTEAMSITLPPVDAPDLEDNLLTSIMAEFQPQLQAYRLDWLHNRAEHIAKSYGSSNSALARRLYACVQGEPGIVQMLKPMLESHEAQLMAQRSRDPRVAILEALWSPSHAQGKLTVSEITTRVNALLRARGSNHDYNLREIGWKLRNLSLSTSSNGKCKALRFSEEARWAIHKQVQQFQLQLPFHPECTDCRARQTTEKEPIE
jgi:hypothetical protein